MNWWWVLILFIKSVVVFAAVISAVPILVWFERRGAGWIQNRRGPNLITLWGIKSGGLILPIADAIKFALKEDIIPNQANKLFYLLAPMILLTTALLTYAVIPIGPIEPNIIAGVVIPPVIHGVPVSFMIAPVDIGVLYILAISGLGLYGILLAGWASNSKYSLLGGIRGGAQLISYEIPMGLAIVGVLLMTGSVDLNKVVLEQGGTYFELLPKWFVLPQFFGFIVFVTALFAETNRLPFDLPEGESEIVAGYHTEYGSMKFMLFYFAEYIAIVTGSMLLVTLYFGGWTMPGIAKLMIVTAAILRAIHMPAIVISFGVMLVPVIVFAVKVVVVAAIFVWIRWTLPRFRYDQLMKLGWKVLLPLALLNIVVTAFFLLK